MTWDGTKGGRSQEQEEEEVGGVGVVFGVIFWRIVGRVEGTCNKKPLALF